MTENLYDIIITKFKHMIDQKGGNSSIYTFKHVDKKIEIIANCCKVCTIRYYKFKENEIICESKEWINYLCEIVKKCLLKCNIFDYIIVGSGTAGSTLVNRLSEDSTASILLIEAGTNDTKEKPNLPINSSEINDITNPFLNKDFKWEQFSRFGLFGTVDDLNNGFGNWEWTPKLRKCGSYAKNQWYPRGNRYGGSSNHPLSALRGDSAQFDDWVKEGLTKWSYEDVLPYFKRSENRSQKDVFDRKYFDETISAGITGSFDDYYHSNNGKIPIIISWYDDPLYSALKASANDLGYSVDIDPDNPISEKEGLFPTPLYLYDQEGTTFTDLDPYNDGGVLYPDQIVKLYGHLGFNGKAKFQRSCNISAYLIPALKRKNVVVRDKCLVSELIFNSACDAVRGIKYLKGENIYGAGKGLNTKKGFGGTKEDAKCNAKYIKNEYSAYARKEVILCAGTFNNPQILMLSGIGPKEHLKLHNICLRKDLPGVGIMQDHPRFNIEFTTKETLDPHLYLNNGRLHKSVHSTFRIKSDPELDKYDFHLEITQGGFNSGVNTDSAKLSPEIGFIPGYSKVNGPPQYVYPIEQEKITHIPQEYGVTCILELVRNIKSRGIVRLKSNSPTDEVDIITNHFKNKCDLERAVKAFKYVVIPFIENLGDSSKGTFYFEGGNNENLLTVNDPDGTNSMGFFDEFINPRVDQFKTNGIFDDEKIEKYILNSVWGINASSTCKMGSSDDCYAVVDQKFRVFGIKNLRICDASVIPISFTSNINQGVTMMAERLAHWLKH